MAIPVKEPSVPARTRFRARLRWKLVAGLRGWAAGSLSDQAAVELLVTCSNGRFVRPGCAWIRPCARPGWYWLDADALTVQAEALTAESERRMLLLAAALVGGDPSTRRRWDESRRAVASRRAAA